MILVDTSVIADILTKDANWFEWSSTEIERWADRGPVCYDAIIFAELAVNFDTQREIEDRLAAFTFLELPLAAAFHAGKAFWKISTSGWKESPSSARLFHRCARLRGPSAVAHSRPPPSSDVFPFTSANHSVTLAAFLSPQ